MSHAPVYGATAVQPDQQTMPDTSKYASWGTNEVAQYFTARGYGEYAALWQQHKLTGERLVLLTPPDMKEMGVAAVGDRLGMQRELRVLKANARREARHKVLGEFREAYDGSYCDEQLDFCCGLCPREPDRYTLTSTSLKIQSYHVTRCLGRIRCSCLGGYRSTDTITLDRIIDTETQVDSRGTMCWKEDKCTITIAVAAGSNAESDESRLASRELLLNADEGVAFAKQIMDAVEEHKIGQKGAVDDV